MRERSRCPRRITEIPVADAKDGPYGITAGPDGALWAALEIGVIARVVAS